ncbi:MAG: hypothetical protein J0L99_19015 [Chitinophagales bacterium]|nr:hypothetical protein [Chitinophagales bacterium]
MKKLVFALTVLIALQYGLNAQNCYIRLSDDSGVAPSQEQLTALENAACRLRDSLPLAFRDSFKVFDFGFYLHNENMIGGYPEVFQQAIAQAGAQSKYYLLFGKQTDKTGVYTKFWVALKMPTTAQFSCMTALQREVFNKRVEAKTKSRYEEEQYLYYSYHKAEIEGIEELIQIINEIKDCCIVADRNGLAEWATGCIGCNEDLARDFFKLENFENFQLNISSAQFADIRSERIRDYSFHKVNYNGGSTHIGQIIESEIEKMNHWFSMNLLITSYESLCIDSIINQDQFSYAEDFHCWINFPTGSGNKSIDIKVTWNKKSNSWIKNQSTANLITNVIKCQILNFLTQSVNFCFETDGIPPEVINIAEYSEFDYFYAIYILNQTSEITMNDLFNAYDDFGGYEPSPQPPPIDEIQNGIDILSTSVAFSVPTTGTLIGRSHRNPPNVEDMQHGTNGDCTGVKFKCMTYIPPSCPQCPENYLDEGELKEYMLALMTFFSKDPLENIAVSFAERFFNKISSDHGVVA